MSRRANTVGDMTNPLAPSADSAYVLGHADTEIRRLLLQGSFYNDPTEHGLRMAGLRPGMRVLDAGCGPGDVSLLASQLVGPTGTVLGVDASADVIELARSRAAELGVTNVHFERASVTDIALDEPVDAVIGRLILVHLPDPVAAIRHLATQVRPGGLIAFCEIDITRAGTIPDTPLYRAMKDVIAETFARQGVDAAFGLKLHSLFQQAGLSAPRLTLSAPLGGTDDIDIFALVVESWRTVFAAAEKFGLVTDELADVGTLLPRLRDEAVSTEAIVMLPPLITAWATV